MFNNFDIGISLDRIAGGNAGERAWGIKKFRSAFLRGRTAERKRFGNIAFIDGLFAAVNCKQLKFR
ncbi:MAG: hypothetical protein LBB85_04110 [Dysgonamonadaceae bacterium]|jgi:hypothetical protein|nr:hypothetical protein [Dysgonamonadaceae bacterium]